MTFNKSQHLFAIALFSLCSLSYADGIGSYSPESQTFILDVNVNLSSDDETIRFGSENMILIIGDWNGNGINTIGIYRADSAWFVRDKGEIVDEGSHQKLIKSDGNYRQLWYQQRGGFLSFVIN